MPTDWDQIKKDADAEKAATDSKKSLADAQKALFDAENALKLAKGPDPVRKQMDDRVAAAKAATEESIAEKAAAEAKKAALDAQEAADPAKKDLDAKAAAAKAIKDAADAEKAAADARKSTTEAQTAALKAQFGDFNASGITGAVDLKDKAGSTEAALLAARSVRLAATRIHDAISLKLKPAAHVRTILLYAFSEMPTFQALLAFGTEVGLARKVFADAGALSEKALNDAPPPPKPSAAPLPPPAPGSAAVTEAALPLAAVGLGLETVNKLLSYFRTDYTVGGIDLTLEDSLLVHAVAGALADCDTFDVKLPAVYEPQAMLNPASMIMDALAAVASLNSDAQRNIAFHEEIAGEFATAAGKAAQEDEKKRLLNNGALHTKAVDALKSAVAVYDTFFGKMTAADDKGSVPLSLAIREAAIADLLDRGAFLLGVKLHKSGGAYYTKKNLWSFFLPGIPMYHMGGVVTSYVLMSGAEGKVIAAGVEPVHGGFVKAKDVEARVKSYVE
ncbi:MAG: hypothetical protein ABJC09_01335 [Terriglobia bacterium]